MDDSGTTDKGDDSSDEVSAPQYISLAAGDSSDDDFQDFQKAATATQTHTPQHQHSPVAQALAFVDRQNAPSGSSTSSLLACGLQACSDRLIVHDFLYLKLPGDDCQNSRS